MRGSSGRPTHCQKRAVVLVFWRVFYARMARLWAATMLVHRSHIPGLQHRHGRPALAQGQLHEKQEAAIEQKQQRSLRALVIFCLLLFLHLSGGALDMDEERLTPSILFARRVCSWWRLAASPASPGAPDGSGSCSLSITSCGCCGGPTGAT
jgi:hypothetical protein